MTEQVGKQVSVYVRASEVALWQRAEAYAAQHRLALSALVMLALEDYLAENDPPARPRRR